MQYVRTLFRSLACLALLSLAGTSSDSIAFAPAAKSSVTKTFVTELETSVASFGVLVGGADPGAPEVTLDTRWTRQLKVSDEYVSTEDGRPKELVRAFDEIRFELEGEVTIDEQGNTGEGTGFGTSELAGKKVRFAWDDGDEDYDASFVDGKKDADLLEGLVEDMDLRAFLPADEVDPGDEWQIDPEQFLATLVPGGDLALDPGLDPPEGDPRFFSVGLDLRTSADLADWLGGTASGKVGAEYVGTRVEDGRTIASIQLTVEVRSEVDAAETMAERMGDDPTGEGLALKMGEATLVLELEGEGELQWDVEAGRLFAYHLEGDVHVSLDEHFAIEGEGQSIAVESTLELDGKLRQQVTVE